MNEVKQILTLEELNSLGRASEVNTEKENKLVREIVSEIKRTMRKNDLLSLSAPGIGYDKRIFCVKFDLEIKTFINPIVSDMKGLQLFRECCSSIPGKEYLRPRNTEISIYYTTPTGMIKNNTFKGVAASVISHELDHLDGVTLEDIGLEVDSDFDSATDEEREEIISMYLDSLDLRQADLNQAIKEDEGLSIINDRLRFMEALARGDITLEKQEE